MIISGFFFVIMHSAVKYLSKEVHIFEIAFFRCALVVFVLAPIIFKQGKSVMITKQPKFQFLRITKNLKPNYFNEKYLIKDKDGKVIKKSESLNFLIDKTSWNKLKLIK